MLSDVHIRQATDADKQAWDAYVLGHPDGVAYHQFAWKEAVESAYGYRGIYLMAERQHQVLGVLPLVLFEVPLRGRALISLPFCDLGGPLALASPIAEALVSEAQRLRQTLGARSLELRNRVPVSEKMAQEEAAKVRMLLQLPESSEQLLAGFKSKLRCQVRKPQRDGLRSRWGGEELVDAFYPIFARNMRDLGSPVHSKRWIASVMEAFGDRARICLVSAPEGNPVAGGVVLLHGKTASNPWSSSLRPYKKLNPNMLLYWSLLSFATDAGCRTFDFGRSTPGEGTFTFKRQWGAQPEALAWEKWDSRGRMTPGAVGDCSSMRRRAEALWACLPVHLCNMVGPVVRRHISL